MVELLGAGFTHEGRRFLLLEHLPEGTLGTFHALSDREQMRSPSAYRLVSSFVFLRLFCALVIVKSTHCGTNGPENSLVGGAGYPFLCSSATHLFQHGAGRSTAPTRQV